MSTDLRQERTGLGDLSRREMLSALARWTAPTVLTLSLGARTAYAAASCPPCTKNTGGKCKACATRDILRCDCEPCLGPDYCSGSGVAPTSPSMASPLGAGGQATPQGRELLNAIRSRRGSDLGTSPFGRSPFSRADSTFGGSSTPFGRTPSSASPEALRLRRQAAARQSLYERLRDPDVRRPR